MARLEVSTVQPAYTLMLGCPLKLFVFHEPYSTSWNLRSVIAGADDFLPVLIYVVIHANPPQLASNLEYIQRFRMGSRMVSESAYFFTQLVSALPPTLPCLDPNLVVMHCHAPPLAVFSRALIF